MNLPIYQENLRSSGDWRAGLTQVRDAWQRIQAEAVVLSQVCARQQHLLGAEVAPENFLAAAQLISARAAVPSAILTMPDVVETNRLLANEERIFRESEATVLNAAHDPPPAVMVPRLLDQAMDWFATAGFAEMNPVEQAALVFLRLLDLQPFAAANFSTAALAAGFYTQRAKLPPLIFDPTTSEYQAVVASAFRLLTQHLVEYFARCLSATISIRTTEII